MNEQSASNNNSVFADIPRQHFGAILADPPWQFLNLWNTPAGPNRGDAAHYSTMTIDEIAALPVKQLAADDCVLFLWSIWILMPRMFEIITAWGFEYKTCAFDWIKANPRQLDMFRDDADVQMGLGYWTRANSEPCLLATRGSPKRLNADVRQGIIEPRREHSRKPDCVHQRVERLVTGPYLELFARQQRRGWITWGNETDKFDADTDIYNSTQQAFDFIRERKANGGSGWKGHE